MQTWPNFFIAKDLQIHVLPKVLYNPKRLEIIKIKNKLNKHFPKSDCSYAFSKKPSFSIKISFSSSKFSLWLMKVEMDSSPPKQLRQTSLGQFLIIITRCCKFSFPSLDPQRLVITFPIIKILSVSIWYSTIPSTWCAKKETFRNWSFMCCPPQERIFSF